MSDAAPRRAAAPLLVGALLALGLAAAAGTSLAPLRRAHEDMKTRGEPLYLPAPRFLEVAALGHRTTLADVLYLWSIQYFSEPAPEGDERTPWVVRVYDAITDLDPHFRDAYWLGFLSLLQEVRDPSAAFALVDKGLANEPDYALLAIDAGFAARELGDTRRMLRHFAIGGRIGKDPTAQRLLLALRTVDTAQEEMAGWEQLLDSPDELTRSIAADHVRDLRMYIDATSLQALVRCYEARRGIAPGSLDQLVRAGYLQEEWVDPEGKSYLYDARTRTVTPQTPYRYRPPSRARHGVDLAQLGACAPASAR